VAFYANLNRFFKSDSEDFRLFSLDFVSSVGLIGMEELGLLKFSRRTTIDKEQLSDSLSLAQ